MTPDTMDYRALLEVAAEAALTAGEEILRIYESGYDVETKADNTPVTTADRASSRTILNYLSATAFPVISEEEPISPYAERSNWDHFWMVDPLDGTREFVKRNGEFTVNIALIRKHRPVIGVIHAPVTGDIYFAAEHLGSFKHNRSGLPVPGTDNWLEHSLEAATRLPLQNLPRNYTLVASRSHLSHEINMRLEQLRRIYDTVDIINAGSSIKQCWVAEGRAHEYSRFGTTMEWDTAAGQCILEQAGAKLVDLETGEAMRYNKENLENRYFIAGH